MKKAELESHHAAYNHRIQIARESERAGLFREALHAAIDALPYIDGMMQYERRHLDRDSMAIHAIDIATKYAPLLLDSRTLDTLDSLLQEFRRIAKNSSDDLPERLRAARDQMWRNYRLWSHLERNPECVRDEVLGQIGGKSSEWQDVLRTWERMGLVRTVGRGGLEVLSLATRLGQVVAAKCQHCGVIVEAPKAMFLEEIQCSVCKMSSLFVLITKSNML